MNRPDFGKGQQHDLYGKSVLEAAAGLRCQTSGPSTNIEFNGSMATIDGTVDSIVAVEVESRTGKQVRGAVLDLILHCYPKKLLILIPMYIQSGTPDQCRMILEKFISRDNFRVVLLRGTGDAPNLDSDAEIVKQALSELGCILDPSSTVAPHEIQATVRTVTIGITEAARVLQELGLCKGIGPSGHINGPNCQRFGRRDALTGRWQWDIAELIRKARQKNSATPDQIQAVAKRYVGYGR